MLIRWFALVCILCALAHAHGQGSDAGVDVDLSAEKSAVGGQSLNLTQADEFGLEWDTNGYFTYVMKGGRFGNLMETFLGALAVSKMINRTFVLPNWRTKSKNARIYPPFEDMFEVESLKAFHRVIPLSAFRRLLKKRNEYLKERNEAPLAWDGMCMNKNHIGKNRHEPPTKCTMPRGWETENYLDAVGITFPPERMITLENPHALRSRHSPGPAYTPPADGDDLVRPPVGTPRCVWGTADAPTSYPSLNPKVHPLVHFLEAPGTSIPAAPEDRTLAKFVRWSATMSATRDRLINKLLHRPFLGIHVRRGGDYTKSVCKELNICYACKECPLAVRLPQKERERQVVSRNVCGPSEEHMKDMVLAVVRKHGVKSLFVAADWKEKELADELDAHLRANGITLEATSVLTGLDRTPEMDLAILGSSDVFIGNCVSTFSAVVKRERDYARRRGSYFWGLQHNSTDAADPLVPFEVAPFLYDEVIRDGPGGKPRCTHE